MASVPPTASGPSTLLNEQGLIRAIAGTFVPPAPPSTPSTKSKEEPRSPNIPNPCDARRTSKIENSQEDTLVVNTKRIQELTQQIRSTVDCNALKLIIRQHLDELKKQAEKAAKEQLDLLKKTLGITSLPSPTPQGIVKWLGKLVTGTIIPTLEAAIKYTLQIIGLIRAVTELVIEIKNVLPRVKACVADIKRTFLSKDALKNEVRKLERRIAEKIADEICKAVGASGLQVISDVITAYRSIEEALDAANALRTELFGSVNSSLNEIGNAQTQMEAITGIAPVIATDSLESFTASVNSGAFETYKAENQAFVEALPPVNDVLPVAAGVAAVGNTVSCNTGVWTSNSEMTYSAQWFREGNPIYNANTFTYSPAMDDIEYNLYCLVTGENKAGSIEVKSNEVGPVVYTVQSGNEPVISGSLSVGSRIECSTGVWVGFTPTRYDYQWIRGSDVVSNANNSYLVVAGDVGQQIKCKVTASSTRYTLAVDSDPVTIP
jgi:RNA-binding protein YhbY